MIPFAGAQAHNMLELVYAVHFGVRIRISLYFLLSVGEYIRIVLKFIWRRTYKILACK